MQSSKLKVFIEDGDPTYSKMWSIYGYDVVNNDKDANIIQFTGGEDVDPMLYGRHRHPTVHYNERRDQHCLDLWERSQKAGKMCVGICRGSQFIHVMNGGQLVQDCNNHGVAQGHTAKLSWLPNSDIIVSSTHHQMMGSPDVGEVLVYTDIASRKLTTTPVNEEYKEVELDIGYDIEGMVYPDTNSLSYQPHPEFSVNKTLYRECAMAYFFMIRNYLEG